MCKSPPNKCKEFYADVCLSFKGSRLQGERREPHCRPVGGVIKRGQDERKAPRPVRARAHSSERASDARREALCCACCVWCVWCVRAS